MVKRIHPLAAVVAAAGIGLLGGCGTGDDPGLASVEAAEGQATSENGAAAVRTLLEGMNAVGEIADVLSGADYRSDEIICSGGGRVQFHNLSLTLEGKVDATAEFAACREGDVTMNGKIHVLAAIDGDAFTGTIVDRTFTVDTAVSAFYDTQMAIAIGSSIKADLTSNSATYQAGTVTSSVQWSSGGSEARYDDLRVAFTADGEASLQTQCLHSGRIYIGDLGSFLQVNAGYDPECTDPFTVDSGALVSGSTQLTGADGTVEVEVTSDNRITVTGSTPPEEIVLR